MYRNMLLNYFLISAGLRRTSLFIDKRLFFEIWEKLVYMSSITS